MRARTLIVLLPLLAANVCLADAEEDLQRLAWMEGTWGGVTKGITIEETWSSPSGGGLIGMHKDSRDGRMVSFEFFRIVPQDSCEVSYLASPGGKTPVAFCATEIGEKRAVFENRSNDFPQRVIYRLARDGRLHARIEGMREGELRFMEWVWTRKDGR